MSQFIQNGSALTGLTSSSLLGSLHSGKIQNQLMEKRIIPPAEGARFFVEPNDQTMTLRAASRPCMEARTQTLLGAGLDNAGSQYHRMVGTPCPTLGCSSVGWSVFEGRRGNRGKEQSFSQTLLKCKPQSWRLSSSEEHTLLKGT